MDFSLSDDLVAIVVLTAGLGALGGFTSDVVYPIRRSGEEPQTGLENRITVPRRYRAKRDGKNRTVAVDLGYIGPIVVGAVAALVAVFAIGVTGPASDEAAQATAQISQELGGEDSAEGADSAALDDASEKLSSRVPIAALIPLALIAGFMGHLVLEAATTRVTSLLGAAAIAGAQPAVGGAVAGVEQAAADLKLDPEQTSALVEAASAGGQEGAEGAIAALEWEPPAEEARPQVAGQS